MSRVDFKGNLSSVKKMEAITSKEIRSRKVQGRGNISNQEGGVGENLKARMISIIG